MISHMVLLLQGTWKPMAFGSSEQPRESSSPGSSRRMPETPNAEKLSWHPLERSVLAMAMGFQWGIHNGWWRMDFFISKWMIWGYPHRKHPCVVFVVFWENMGGRILFDNVLLYIYIIIYHVPQPESCIKKCHDMLGKGRNKMSALRFFRPKCFWKSVDWRTWSCFDVFSWDSSGLPGFPS